MSAMMGRWASIARRASRPSMACTVIGMLMLNVLPPAPFGPIEPEPEGTNNSGPQLAVRTCVLRAGAAVVMYVLHLGLRRGRQPMDVRLLSMAATVLFLAQVIVGALTIWLKFPEEIRALHLALGTAVWAAMAGLAALSLAPRDQAGWDQAGSETVHA